MAPTARLAVAASAALSLALSAASSATDGGDPVVLQVGDVSLRVSDVEHRLEQVPVFQLETYGDTPSSIRKRFLETVLVPELLFALAGRDRDIHEQASMQPRVREALRRALEEDLRNELQKTQPASLQDVKDYYARHEDQFQTPQRIRIWRIVVPTEELANRILSELERSSSIETWAELARKHSMDEATRMRHGDLGFVYPDGRTAAPQVRVDAGLFEAASDVKDGQIVPGPVEEGDRFAVVWRRGSLDPVSRPLEQEREAIEQVLTRQRTRKAALSLLERLKKRHLKAFHPELLEQLPKTEPEPPSAQSLPAKMPPRQAAPEPKETEHGLR